MRGFFGAIIALLLVSTAQLGAQTLITNNSLMYLSNAVATGGTNLFTFSGTITITNVLYVQHDTTLLATNSVTITGTGSNGLFYVEPGVIFTISNLTLSGGRSIGTNGWAGYNGSTGSGGSKGNAGGNGNAGASGQGGAIFNAGTFKATYCQFITNIAVGGNGGNGGTGGNGSFSGGSGGNGANGSVAYGGAIYNLGTLLLSNSTLFQNSATGGNGGQGGTNGTGGDGYPGNGGTGGTSAGAAIYNAGNATILACTIAYNLAQSGATQASGNPIGNGNGQQGSTGATAEGGGIYNAGTNLTIINSTFVQNFVEAGGGGNGANATTGFTGGNGGNGGLGAGGNLYNSAGALTIITNCTFAAGECFGGTNGLGGGGADAGGNGQSGGSSGANIANLGTLLLRATILAYPTNSSNYYGNVTDQGDNLSTDGSPTFSHTNSLNYNDPLLAGLAANGGPTLTLALQLSYTNNPAINAIKDTNNGYATVDQRGYPRPFSTNYPDIGAYEYGATAFTVSGNITLLGEAFSNVVVSATSTNSVLTDQDGNYLLTNLVSGSYTITPTLAGYTFTPTYSNITINASTSNINFAAQPIGYAVMGQVTSGSTTNGYTNVTVTLIGTNYLETVDQTTQTDTNGNFTFGNVNPGTYLVNLPNVNGISFVSPSTTVVVPPGTNLAIIASLNQARVTGTVTSNGAGFPGVTISFVGTDALGNGETNNSVTGPAGTFSVILYDGNYVIKALPANTFTPASYNEALFAVLTSNINFSFSSSNTTPPAGGTFKLNYNRSNAYVTLSFTGGTSNVVYRIQSSTNLLISNWTTISTSTANAGGMISITNPSTNILLRFFRAITP